LLVYKIEFGAGTTTGNERVSLFVNPALGTEPATASASALDVGSFIFDRIRIQAGNGDSGSVDEIRFGTTYADVVPEPSAALMAALGVFSLVLRRRRA
jgi:MYXO-CTERM domain-containing protein